jgi:hypothetical protein
MAYMTIVGCSFALAVFIAAIVLQVRKTAQQVADAFAKLDLTRCDVCGSTDCQAYEFFTLRSFGLAPIAHYYDLKSFAHSLCPEHARAQCFASCLSIGLKGHWGFPGCVAGPLYVLRNLFSLTQRGTLTLRSATASAAVGIFLGWVLLAVGLLLVVGAFGLYFFVQEGCK